MLIEEKTFKNKNGVIGYYDAIFKSSNILQSTFFPQQQRLYISFNRGGVYSYENISHKLYEEFKIADSQGEFFAKDIRKHPELYPYRKEFTLYPEEINRYKEIVEKHEINEDFSETESFSGTTKQPNLNIDERREYYIDFMNEYNALMGDGEYQILPEEVEVLLANYNK